MNRFENKQCHTNKKSAYDALMCMQMLHLVDRNIQHRHHQQRQHSRHQHAAKDRHTQRLAIGRASPSSELNISDLLEEG